MLNEDVSELGEDLTQNVEALLGDLVLVQAEAFHELLVDGLDELDSRLIVQFLHSASNGERVHVTNFLGTLLVNDLVSQGLYN